MIYKYDKEVPRNARSIPNNIQTLLGFNPFNGNYRVVQVHPSYNCICPRIQLGQEQLRIKPHCTHFIFGLQSSLGTLTVPPLHLYLINHLIPQTFFRTVKNIYRLLNVIQLTIDLNVTKRNAGLLVCQTLS